MSILTYSVRTTYPRIFVTQAEKNLIATRRNYGWFGYWTGDLQTWLWNALSDTDQNLADDTNAYSKFMCLGLYGWIENQTSYHNKLLSTAKWLANNPTYWYSWATRRWTVLALSYAYNFLRTSVITFPEADRKVIGDALISMCNASASEYDFLDGHSGGNMMAQAIAGLTLHGESGAGYNYTTSATNLINAAFNFWYGDTPGDHACIEAFRYFGNAGAHWNGSQYSQIGLWKATFLLNAIRTGCLQNSESPGSLQLNGEDYDPITTESWLQHVGEWGLHAWIRGDWDYWPLNDTQKDSNPWMGQYMRHPLAFLVQHGGAWRKQLHWLISHMNGIEQSQGAWWAPNIIHDVLFYDPSDSNNVAIHPKDASPAISTSRFFMPPGSYWYHSTWEYEKSCIVNIECAERYYMGHQHLNCGAIQIGIKDDVVLQQSGMYNNTDQYAKYGGSHHLNYTQQSIAHSGVPLVDDGVTTHQNYAAAGGYTTYPSGLGGQLWKTYTTGGQTYKDCFNLTSMRFDGGGQAWWKSSPQLVSSTADYDFIHCDVRRAYAKDYQDMDTDLERVRQCHIKYCVIKTESSWPIILRVVHLKTRLPTFAKRDQFHSHGRWNFVYPHQTPSGNGDTMRCWAAGIASQGRICIDLYNYQDYTVRQVGGGALNAVGYYANQFYYGGMNYPPADVANYRHKVDLGYYRLEFEATIQRTEEYWVELLHPLLLTEEPLAYTWINEANWYGIRFSSSSHEYRIHKTLPQVIVSTDTTPPGVPTGVTATPGNTKVTVGWLPNTEQDIYSYKVYYREK